VITLVDIRDVECIHEWESYIQDREHSHKSGVTEMQRV